jgi:hypothetical protein
VDPDEPSFEHLGLSTSQAVFYPDALSLLYALLGLGTVAAKAGDQHEDC